MTDETSDKLRETPCCGYKWSIDGDDPKGPIFWNPFNRAVQCHACGTAFGLAAPSPGEDGLRAALEKAKERFEGIIAYCTTIESADENCRAGIREIETALDGSATPGDQAVPEARVSVPEGWATIDSAPKDRSILGWGVKVGHNIVFWSGKQWDKCEMSAQFQLGEKAITHWQPLRSPSAPQGASVSPRGAEEKLWLWKNFVDGRPEYWAFDNPFPTIDGGDPMTLGQPCGYALFKPSTNGRPDVSDETVIADIRAAKE